MENQRFLTLYIHSKRALLYTKKYIQFYISIGLRDNSPQVPTRPGNFGTTRPIFQLTPTANSPQILGFSPIKIINILLQQRILSIFIYLFIYLFICNMGFNSKQQQALSIITTKLLSYNHNNNYSNKHYLLSLQKHKAFFISIVTNHTNLNNNHNHKH